MTKLPDRMTDAAYQRALARSKKELDCSQEEYNEARCAWERSSLFRSGIRAYLATWLRMHETRREVKKKQGARNLLAGFKQIR
ncbi:hypothetical protein [Methanoregula boonei]|jgi:hypothetical protein|nr:hypothetical protein [Methanoregula boonei]